MERRARQSIQQRVATRGALAAIVAERRLELDLRQAELAELAGCSQRFVSQVESGNQNVQLGKLLDLLTALGLHLEVERGVDRAVVAGPRIAELLGIGARAEVDRTDV